MPGALETWTFVPPTTTDREMLMFVYGAIKTLPEIEELAPILKEVEMYLHPTIIVAPSSGE